ncbi:expressed protein [Echinococcus multilocularis]|uniref:Expressed protein n=1 Tax=Echinococcus multilocularis TaxID=6211 RepID=A0A068YC40_ECHMU|nr:expressed protein [Echinococcus multilocularis]
MWLTSKLVAVARCLSLTNKAPTLCLFCTAILRKCQINQAVIGVSLYLQLQKSDFLCITLQPSVPPPVI